MRLIDSDALLTNTILNPLHSPYITQKDVESAPTVSGWVSVKDRMPEKPGDYLVYTRDGIVWPYFFSSGIFVDDLGFSTDTVTHWMPLPEPPKEGCEDEPY